MSWDSKIEKRVFQTRGASLWLTSDGDKGARLLAVEGNATGFQNPIRRNGNVWLFPCSPENASALREGLAWLKPTPLGLRTSMGFGDRLGFATVGHLRAVRETNVAPIFAQQSVRENARTGRTPQQVLDDAMWAVLAEGWQEPWGADADHIKNVNDVETFVKADYTFFTVDPGEGVDSAAENDSVEILRHKVAHLPWEELQSAPEQIYRTYLAKTFRLEGFDLQLDETVLLRASAKYGRSLAHARQIYERTRELMGNAPFDFEISVDETDQPTSVQEHFYIASELKRLGVTFVSLAPRFVGRFEKGVDYIGDPIAFERELARHVAVMRHFGTYKLSLHSGSDKLSLYPLFARYTEGQVHVKTAGTSYLEALRTLAQCDPHLFRDILDYARARYETDRATYHVSARLENVRTAQMLSDPQLVMLLDEFDARQVLHVTFGSVLALFGDALRASLAANLPAYHQALYVHFK
ncbi:MAG TPA: tagaturonate epimerase family protein, partial [Anaerolineae bacterium]